MVPSAGDALGEDESVACEFLQRLFEKIERTCDNVTVVIEESHVDPSYRNMYYHQYSREFFESGRFSLRLVFFSAVLDSETYSSMSKRKLSELCIGACVVSPLGDGAIGRTLVNPKYLIDRDVEIRLSRFPINVLGKRLVVSAFPYRKQDGEMMKCAEVTLLNLLCYYSNEYPDYHTALPSEIVSHEETYSNERVTPSRGLPYVTLSKILSDFRFFPRLYNIDDVGCTLSTTGPVSKDVAFRRLLHWYVCSGIPVAVNVGSPHTMEDGHSLICIGYEDVHRMKGAEPSEGGDELENRFPRLCPAILNQSYRLTRRDDVTGESRSCEIIHSADFERKFVVIDDGQQPYEIRPFDMLSEESRFSCINFAVPLHRSMAMDALDAYENAISIMSNRDIGLLNWGSRTIGEGERLVMSLFLTTVRGYKRERSKHERRKHKVVLAELARAEEAGDAREYCSLLRDKARTHDLLSTVYETIALPHFIWVVELTRLDSYQTRDDIRRACIEIIFDAGSGSAGNAVDKLILMRYPDRLYYRDQEGKELYVPIADELVDQNPIKPYRENLKRMRSRWKGNKS